MCIRFDFLALIVLFLSCFVSRKIMNVQPWPSKPIGFFLLLVTCTKFDDPTPVSTVFIWPTRRTNKQNERNRHQMHIYVAYCSRIRKMYIKTYRGKLTFTGEYMQCVFFPDFFLSYTLSGVKKILWLNQSHPFSFEGPPT